jgi:D-beta-D-heptose 7-phosphate kinase/D-beta-D-heptose 1-phosphate adenosyltransferase
VDYIILFSESSPVKQILSIKPNLYIKGGDYTIDKLNQEERKAVENNGGKIILIDMEKDVSTTKMIEKILNSKETK